MVKIINASVSLLRYPLGGATGGSGITHVDVIICDLETSTGHSGTGFSYVLGGDGRQVAAIGRSLLSNYVVGEELKHPQLIWRKLASSLNRTGRGFGYLAIAAIDLSVWDLYSKIQGVPLGVAMGGELRSVPVYGSGGFGPSQEPEAAAAQALDYVKRGLPAIKLRFSGDVTDLDRLSAVADALPPGVGIMADLNEKANLAQATHLLNACHDFNLMWIEEPLPSHDINAYKKLAAQLSVPIAVGEHHQGLMELAPFFNSQAISIVQPDLAMMGGVTEALRLANIAEYFGVSVAPHFLPALFIHLAAAAPSVRWLEDFPLLEALFHEPLTFDQSGMMELPTGPGHGLAWLDGVREEYGLELDN